MARATDLPASAPTPGVRRQPGPGWSRIFGYDIFISFALGPPPRGSRGYASDLARRLRERGFTVFFSEDEAPAGGELDGTLRRALRASRVLVVLANEGTLREPRWVRSEVEEFVRSRPGRSIVPISFGGALGDAKLGPATQAWMPFRQRIWIDETREAGESGTVSEAVVDRLVTAPHAVRSTLRLRAVVGATLAFLALLAGVALWQRQVAVGQLRIAQSRELAVSATAQLAADPERAVLLAAAGMALAPTVESESALRAALLEPRGRRVLEGVLGEAWGVAPMPDGRRFAVVGDAGARVLDVQDGAAAGALAVPRLRTVAVASDGRLALSTDDGGEFQVWPTGAPGPGWQARGKARFSPDSLRVAAFGDGPCVHLRDAATGAPGAELCAAPGRVRAAAFSPDGSLLATGGEDGALRVWEVASGRVVQELRASTGAVGRVAFSADGRLAATVGSAATSVQLWDARTWTAGAEIRPDYPLVDAVFSPDGEAMAIVPSLGFQVQVFGTRDGRPSMQLAGHTGRIFGAAYSPDGAWLLTASDDRTARLWDARDGSPVAVLRGHGNVVTAARFTPDGQRMLTSSLDGSARVWEAMRITDVAESPAAAAPAGRAVAAVAAGVAASSADGRLAVRLAQDQTAEVVEVATGQVLASLRGDRDNWDAASFNPDGTLVLTSGGHNAATLWDARTGARLMAFDAGASAARFTPEGRRVVVTAGGRTRSYACAECASGEALLALARARATRTLTADERRLYLHQPAASRPAPR